MLIYLILSSNNIDSQIPESTSTTQESSISSNIAVEAVRRAAKACRAERRVCVKNKPHLNLRLHLELKSP